MSGTDPGPLPTSKMELAVTIMAPPYMPSLPYWSGDARIYLLHLFIIYITHIIVIL